MWPPSARITRYPDSLNVIGRQGICQKAAPQPSLLVHAHVWVGGRHFKNMCRQIELTVRLLNQTVPNMVLQWNMKCNFETSYWVIEWSISKLCTYLRKYHIQRTLADNLWNLYGGFSLKFSPHFILDFHDARIKGILAHWCSARHASSYTDVRLSYRQNCLIPHQWVVAYSTLHHHTNLHGHSIGIHSSVVSDTTIIEILEAMRFRVEYVAAS